MSQISLFLFLQVHVEMEDKADKIIVEGPVEEVESVRGALQATVDDLLGRLTFVDLTVDPKYHKHIIGMMFSFFVDLYIHRIHSYRQGWFKRKSSEGGNWCHDQYRR